MMTASTGGILARGYGVAVPAATTRSRRAATVPDLLRIVVGAEPGRPAVTWLDPTSGARVELSRVTLANWVAKIGGLLQDVAEVESGDTVRLQLPAHWLGVAWPLACWSVGAVVQPGDTVAADPPDLVVVGDEEGGGTARLPEPTPGRLVVVGLGPLGGRARPPVPDGALDAGAEVLGQPDDLLAHDPPGPGTPAVHGLDHASLLAAATDRAAALGLGAEGRLATDVGPCSAAGLVETVLAPLVVGGSLVLLTPPGPPLDRPAGQVAGLAAEQPDVLGGSLRG